MSTESVPSGSGLATTSADRLRPGFENPLSSLPETARNLLVAAKEIIADEGFEGLTLKTVSERAGENKAMISYYFDNKAGLIAAVVDSVVHDEYVASLERMKAAAPGERTQRLVEEMHRMDAAAADFQVFFELLPHVLRDEVLRRRLALLYEWYWSMKLDWLGVASGPEALADPDLLGLAQLLSAIIDGLAIQVAIDPNLKLANPYRVFSTMLDAALAGLALQPATRRDGPADPGTGQAGRRTAAAVDPRPRST